MIEVSRQNKSDQIYQRCEVYLFDPKSSQWEEVKNATLSIEQAHFGEKAFNEKIFKKAFMNSQTVVVLLKDRENNRIVGFSYAEPLKNAARYGFDSERSILPKTAY